MVMAGRVLALGTRVNAPYHPFGDVEARLEDILASLGYDVRIRGETLDIEGFARISDAIYLAQTLDF